MTPEQKVFYEYGKARGRLEGRREEFVFVDMPFGISRAESVGVFRRCFPFRRSLVKDAWRKRAVCRRRCSECQTYALLVKKPDGGVWCPDAEINTNGNARCVGCPFFEQMKGDW